MIFTVPTPDPDWSKYKNDISFSCMIVANEKTLFFSYTYSTPFSYLILIHVFLAPSSCYSDFLLFSCFLHFITIEQNHWPSLSVSTLFAFFGRFALAFLVLEKLVCSVAGIKRASREKYLLSKKMKIKKKLKL